MLLNVNKCYTYIRRHINYVIGYGIRKETLLKNIIGYNYTIILDLPFHWLLQLAPAANFAVVYDLTCCQT